MLLFASHLHNAPQQCPPQKKTAPHAPPACTGWLPPTGTPSCCQSSTHRATLGQRRIGAAAVFGGWGTRGVAGWEGRQIFRTRRTGRIEGGDAGDPGVYAYRLRRLYRIFPAEVSAGLYFVSTSTSHLC